MSKLFLLGEAYGENEDKIKKAFVGTAGVLLIRMLADAGLLDLSAEDEGFLRLYWQTSDPTHVDMVWNLHPEFHRSNVFNLRPRGNKIEDLCGGKAQGIKGFTALTKAKYVRVEFESELERLGDELVSINPNLVVALGNTACWALLNKTSISKIRGTTTLSTHTVSGFKVLPTYHPAAIGRQWELRPTTVMDLMKAKREQAYADIRRPQREIWIEPSLEEVKDFIKRFVLSARSLSIDIETSGNRITCIGIAPNKRMALVIPFTDRRRLGGNYWPTTQIEVQVWKIVKGVLESPIPKTFQNGLYDIAFIWRSTGIKVYGAEEDTMLLHHALQPEALKGLGYLGSVYTDEGSWKQMREKVGTIKRDD